MWINEYGVREKTLEEELQDLEDMDQHDKDRILKKYYDERDQEKERAHRELHNLSDENSRLKAEVKALIGYIQLKEYV